MEYCKISYFSKFKNPLGFKSIYPVHPEIELKQKKKKILMVLKNVWNVEKIIFNHDFFFLSVCLDSDNQDNLRMRNRRNFVLVIKCLYFQFNIVSKCCVTHTPCFLFYLHFLAGTPALGGPLASQYRNRISISWDKSFQTKIETKTLQLYYNTSCDARRRRPSC